MKNLMLFVSAWMILAISVLGLALYRKFISAHEEDRYVHISEGEARLIPHQVEVNQRIAHVDHWGELLTILTLVAGVALAGIYVYQKL
ncbi:MAG: hypothetical protein ACJ746_20770 [Bryobacteraceae bacterium]